MTTAADGAAGGAGYVLDDQVGFLLRQVQQRHVSIFARHFGVDMTPMQWAALAKLAEVGECSQNLLGRHTAMDVATIKGVAERLAKRMSKGEFDLNDLRTQLKQMQNKLES